MASTLELTVSNQHLIEILNRFSTQIVDTSTQSFNNYHDEYADGFYCDEYADGGYEDYYEDC